MRPVNPASKVPRMKKLDGQDVAKKIRERIKADAAAFAAKAGRPPGLTVILVGDDPASQVYVRNKIKACEAVGIASFEERLPADISMAGLKAVIDRLNEDPRTDGMILQLPLPKGLNADEAIQWISPKKDADCLTAENLGRLWVGRPLTIPCTPWGVMKILEHYEIPVAGRSAVVIGRSQIVGKPMAHLLTQADATVTVCHSKTKDLKPFLKNAEIVVVAAGKPEFLGGGDFAPGSVVIDVGIHRKTGIDGKKLCGDVRYDELAGVASAATPVPGGVGPMTITMLLENTLRLAKQSLQL